jgi:phage terminase large subunit
MSYQTTTAVKKIAGMKKRLKIIQGGSSAGKTIAILLLLIDIAQSAKENLLISIVSETMPHLKRGAIRDFINIMESHKYYKDERWNRTDFIYTFESGSKIEFFSADNSDKVRGPRRDILFLNEANNIPFETYTQLAIRTKNSIYIDYNPVAEFWVHTDLLKNTENDFLIITYKDNEALSPAIVEELESRQYRKSWWQVYGLGQLGEVEGKIYKDWQVIDFIPHEARLVRRGLDFGYTNDPTAIIDVYYYNGGYIFDEIMYLKGQSNQKIADFLGLQEKETLTIADSAEPKSIDEIKLYGVNIMATTKGQGSILAGIQFVQGQRISMTKNSVNLIREYRSYLFKADKNTGKILNEAEDKENHAMDAIRYAMMSLSRPQEFQTTAKVSYTY